MIETFEKIDIFINGNISKTYKEMMALCSYYFASIASPKALKGRFGWPSYREVENCNNTGN